MKKLISILILSVISISVLTSCSAGKEYVIVTDSEFEPYCYTDGGGNAVGFDVDLISEIADTANIKIKVFPVSLTDAFEALDNNDADAIIAALTPTDEFMEKYDFSDEYFNGYALAVRKGENDALIQKFNSALTKIKESGFIDELCDKYALGEKNE